MASSSLTTAGSVDPADEAGGEVIFSSDGMDPLPPTKPPTLATPSSDGTAVLDSSNIQAQTAFEVFQGKLYYLSWCKLKKVDRNQKPEVPTYPHVPTAVLLLSV